MQGSDRTDLDDVIDENEFQMSDLSHILVGSAEGALANCVIMSVCAPAGIVRVFREVACLYTPAEKGMGNS